MCSRMESTSDPGRVNLSSAARRALFDQASDVAVLQRGELPIKGKDKPERCFWLLDSEENRRRCARRGRRSPPACAPCLRPPLRRGFLAAARWLASPARRSRRHCVFRSRGRFRCAASCSLRSRVQTCAPALRVRADVFIHVRPVRAPRSPPRRPRLSHGQQRTPFRSEEALHWTFLAEVAPRRGRRSRRARMTLRRRVGSLCQEPRGRQASDEARLWSARRTGSRCWRSFLRMMMVHRRRLWSGLLGMAAVANPHHLRLTSANNNK